MRLYLAQVATHPSYVDVFGAMPTRTAIMGGAEMQLYLAGICVGQTSQLLFNNREREREMKLYFAGEHTIKNGQLRQTGGGGKTFSFWNHSTTHAKTNTFPSSTNAV